MLFMGDDWAKGHHDVEVEGGTGHVWRGCDYLKASTGSPDCARWWPSPSTATASARARG